MQYKIDLLDDDQLAADRENVKVGDIITVTWPGATEPSKEKVESRIETEVEPHPETGEHLTRVTLLLNTVRD